MKRLAAARAANIPSSSDVADDGTSSAALGVLLVPGTRRMLPERERDAFIVVPLAAMRAAVESVVRIAFTEALADRIAEAVACRLGAASSAEVYSTSKLGPHVPGKSRDWMLRNVKRMRGAVKVGRDWQITRTDFLAWRREEDAADVRMTVKRAIIEPDDEALASEALRNAGYRPNGKRGR
jgi:hypothetical protein